KRRRRGGAPTFPGSRLPVIRRTRRPRARKRGRSRDGTSSTFGLRPEQIRRRTKEQRTGDEPIKAREIPFVAEGPHTERERRRRRGEEEDAQDVDDAPHAPLNPKATRRRRR